MRLLVYAFYVPEQLVVVLLGLFYHKLIYLVHRARAMLVIRFDDNGRAFALPTQLLVINEYHLVIVVHFALWDGLLKMHATT